MSSKITLTIIKQFMKLKKTNLKTDFMTIVFNEVTIWLSQGLLQLQPWVWVGFYTRAADFYE